MTKAEEIIEYLENYEGTKDEQEDRYYNPRSAIGHQDFDQTEIESKFGELEYVLCAERGSQGDHDSAETVILFKEHNIYISIDAWYSSQEGTNFEDGEFQQVYPRTKVVNYFSTEEK